MPRSIPELICVPDTQRDRAWLLESLQSAVALEFSTIPLYLSAMWSIQTPDASVDSAYSLIQDIAIEEMLHFGLACNMLASLGGTPDIAGAVPTYQRRGLPGGVKPYLYVTLAGLTLDRVTKLFMEIEYPEGGPVTRQAAVSYPTIGAFYDAIKAAFTARQWTLDGQKQLTFPTTGQAWLTPVLSSNDFTTAITTIQEQGEGTSTTPEAPISGNELAHYYKFGSIANAQLYVQQADGSWSYTGASVPFPSVYPVMEVPAGGYPNPPAAEQTFNQAFTDLVNTLQSAWSTGGSAGNQLLDTAVNEKMGALNPLAVALTQQNYCPTFAYLSAQAA